MNKPRINRNRLNGNTFDLLYKVRSALALFNPTKEFEFYIKAWGVRHNMEELQTLCNEYVEFF